MYHTNLSVHYKQIHYNCQNTEHYIVKLKKYVCK